MATSWTNADGLVQYFGTRDVENDRLRVISDNGVFVTAMCDIDLSDLPSPTASDESLLMIPADSVIISAYLQCITALAGTTPTLTVGLQTLAGSEVDNDGIQAAATAAELSEAGEVHQCNGALVCSAGASVTPTTADGYLVATTANADNTGLVRLIVTYLKPVSYDS